MNRTAGSTHRIWNYHLILTAAIVSLSVRPCQAELLYLWDFSESLHAWTGNARVTGLQSTDEGMDFESTGLDPWVEGPSRRYPNDQELLVTIRMRSTADPSAEMFYGRTFVAEKSVRFTANTDGEWHDYTLMLPALGPTARLRLDPCGFDGHITVAWIRVDTLVSFEPPAIETPKRPSPGDGQPAVLQSGELQLVHFGERWGGFVLNVDGVEMASGHDSGRIGFSDGEQGIWLELRDAEFQLDPNGDSRLVANGTVRDASDGVWNLRRVFSVDERNGTIDIETTLETSVDRELVHFPWLTLLPGLEQYEERKHQALLSGVEYLADEPSSSEADIRGPAHVRRVPNPLDFTQPLMTINQEGRYLGLIWEPSDMCAAIFDSPDRVFESNAHLFALWAPGVGRVRMENMLYAYAPVTVRAGDILRQRCTLVAGMGESVVPAVQDYVALKGLPDLPEFEGGLQTAVDRLAHGWLDSAVHDDGRWRHAVWGSNFPAQAASDASVFMRWLANHAEKPSLATRLVEGAERGLERRRTDDPNYLSGVSHVRFPISALLFGNVFPHLGERSSSAFSIATRFDGFGIRQYIAPAGGTDYGATHFADHTNGLSATDLATILEVASLTGDDRLVTRGLTLLAQITERYANTVPRGAQTWEVPLHTPDILASAYMLKCCLLGYEMTGNREFLEKAEYWAWTGVPFVYLVSPTSGDIGEYATIPVYGATNWQAPLWIGLPVQWCGLVYRTWLHELSRHDPDGPWEQIAKGITLTGLQMSWLESDGERQGLLPDIFDLEGQHRDGPAINPGTVQAGLPEAFGLPGMYAFRRLPEHGWFLHVPGEIEELQAGTREVRITTGGWGTYAYRILVSRIDEEPESVSDRTLDIGGIPNQPAIVPFQYDAEKKLLIVETHGHAEITIVMPHVSVERWKRE